MKLSFLLCIFKNFPLYRGLSGIYFLGFGVGVGRLVTSTSALLFNLLFSVNLSLWVFPFGMLDHHTSTAVGAVL